MKTMMIIQWTTTIKRTPLQYLSTSKPLLCSIAINSEDWPIPQMISSSQGIYTWERMVCTPALSVDGHSGSSARDYHHFAPSSSLEDSTMRRYFIQIPIKIFHLHLSSFLLGIARNNKDSLSTTGWLHKVWDPPLPPSAA